MSPPPAKTTFLRNLYTTPADWQRDLFYSAVRAGHLAAGPEHRIERETYPGHELILCLEGRGWVQVLGRRHQVGKGQLLWVNCHHPHAYGAVARNPWELYWLRIEGRPLDRTAELLSVGSQPVFGGSDLDRLKSEFERIFELMVGPRPSDAAGINAAIAEIIGIAFESRLSEPGAIQPELPTAVVRALEKMRLYFHQSMRVTELADLSGMSESHFSRQFKAAMGTSPIDWLRRERINQAKRRLIESSDPVKEVARQVGYSDQFFFSKDFKKMVGHTPSEFRLKENQSGSADG
ncbi:MAG: AraC family transcriptional regulator [Verrucomicrobiaceae bacterium]|nr:AraC family transcriptional regulator [Verrucomicrobiaceae bacterium]